MSVSFRWLGHSSFAFSIDGHSVYVDPFITNNPLSPISVQEADPEVILVTHGHGDHVGDTVEIARRTGALVISNVEVINWLQRQGVENAVGVNTGGTFNMDFMSVKWTLAFHSSSLPDGSYGGMPNGIILIANSGLKIYFAGDTALFRDMELIGDEGIDVAFLPIGDHFTMGISDSIRAINFIRPRAVVPMHYNTFQPIVQNVSEWARRVHEETRAVPLVLDPGQSHTLGS
jgi:L-ascorbate metabolism protein UlaG (beta-lactamase superfamily)